MKLRELLEKIVPIVAFFMVIVGGVMWITAYSDLPDLLTSTLQFTTMTAAVVTIGAFLAKATSGSMRKFLTRVSLGASLLAKDTRINPPKINKTSTTESAKIAGHGAFGFLLSVLLLLAFAVLGYATQDGVFYDARYIALGLCGVILMYRGLLVVRVREGYFGLNQEEALFFYAWLKKKSDQGDSDFGGRSVEDLKQEFLKDLDYKPGHIGAGAH